MKIVCPTCNTRYDIPGDKIPQGRTLVETCKNCGGQIVTEIEEFQFMAGEDEFKGYAGFRKRFSAAIIDGFILAVAGLIIGGLAGFIYGYRTGTPEGAGALGNIVGVILGWLYFALMESSSKQGTLGKMALGIKVTDLSGNAISFGRATVRHFGKILSTIILLAGYLMVAFTAKKQGLHDMIAGCLVVKQTALALKIPLVGSEMDNPSG
jgi:predicted Zn finger-like uncharacterized protein